MIDTDIEVMFFDTDCGGVVSNIAYLRFFEVARTRLTDALGLSLAEMVATQVFPAVCRTEVDYRKPARLGDRLRIRGTVERCEKVRLHCRFEMHRLDGDRALIAECRQVVVLVQMPEGRPRRLPEAWLGAGPPGGGGDAPPGEPAATATDAEPRGFTRDMPSQ